jgi:hypothetical protein
MNPDDRRWLWLVYATVLVPLVGQALVVVGSSALYFQWRHAWPMAARRLNRHAWLAVGLKIAFSFAARRVLRS